MLGAVPEGVAELGVVLDGNGVDGAAHLERPLLELHHAGVVDASACKEEGWRERRANIKLVAFWEDEDGEAVRVIHMLLQPLHNCRKKVGLNQKFAF